MTPVLGDFTEPLRLPEGGASGARLGFFPGSTLGNFTPDAAVGFLTGAKRLLGPEARLLIGVDLVKDEAPLVRAYDDEEGVTAAFNKNLLVRINHELRGSFALDAFDHRAVWNRGEQRVEMHLVSRVAQTVAIGAAGITVAFECGEHIWTESSYKYQPDRIERMAVETGFGVRDQWIDDDAQFALSLMTAI